MHNKQNHVLTEINTLSSKFDPQNKGDHIMVKCPFHSGGRERTPSCSVNISKNNIPIGYFHCLACHSKGNWNKFAKETGLKGFKAADQINDIFSFTLETTHRSTQKVPKEKYTKLKPWSRHKKWRKIEPRIIRMYSGCYPESYAFEDDFLYFPVLVNNDYVGGIYARLVVNKRTKEEGLSSYINTSGSWMKEALFGYNIAKQQKGPLWIVEGPRDVMKTRQVGGRVVGLCGAYVSKKKISLIEALDPPVIVIASDPDEAGDKVRKTLEKELSHFPILKANFPSGKDPACFTPKSYYSTLVKLGLKKKRDL